MNNEHLVPVNVQDIANRLYDKNLSANERLVLLQRLDAIREYTETQYKKHNFVDFGQTYSGRK